MGSKTAFPIPHIEKKWTNGFEEFGPISLSLVRKWVIDEISGVGANRKEDIDCLREILALVRKLNLKSLPEGLEWIDLPSGIG